MCTAFVCKKVEQQFLLPTANTHTHTHSLSPSVSRIATIHAQIAPYFITFFLYITNLYPGLRVSIFPLLFLPVAPCPSLTRFFFSLSRACTIFCSNKHKRSNKQKFIARMCVDLHHRSKFLMASISIWDICGKPLVSIGIQ